MYVVETRSALDPRYTENSYDLDNQSSPSPNDLEIPQPVNAAYNNISILPSVPSSNMKQGRLYLYPVLIQKRMTTQPRNIPRVNPVGPISARSYLLSARQSLAFV